MNGKELIKILMKEGFELKSIVGSHHKMVRDNTYLIVPVHGTKDIKPGTLNSILKKAGIK